MSIIIFEFRMIKNKNLVINIKNYTLEMTIEVIKFEEEVYNISTGDVKLEINLNESTSSSVLFIKDIFVHFKITKEMKNAIAYFKVVLESKNPINVIVNGVRVYNVEHEEVLCLNPFDNVFLDIGNKRIKVKDSPVMVKLNEFEFKEKNAIDINIKNTIDLLLEKNPNISDIKII